MSAATPAAHVDDDEEPRGIIGTPVGSRYRKRHGGHNVTIMREVDWDNDGDYYEAVICDSCYTIGDLFYMDGMSWIDMAHNGDDDESTVSVYGRDFEAVNAAAGRD